MTKTSDKRLFIGLYSGRAELLDGTKPVRKTRMAECLTELLSRTKRREIVMIFSDFFTDLPARLARLLHELESRKWVSRRASGTDGRSHSIHLTGDGEKALVKIKGLAERHEGQLADYVGPKRHRQLMSSLRGFG